MTVNSEKKFISNCLFQAIKYKLKNWKKVKIKYLWYRGKRWYHLHFYWQDDEYDYDFSPCRLWCGQPLFKGCIRKHKKGSFDRLKKCVHYDRKRRRNIKKQGNIKENDFTTAIQEASKNR